MKTTRFTKPRGALWIVIVAIGLCGGCKKSEAPKATRAPGGAPLSVSIPAPPSQASLDLSRIRLIPQEQSQWCWAASSEMVLLYLLQVDVRQCKLANEENLAAQDCCPSNPNCDTSAYPDVLFSNRKVKFASLGNALSLLQLENEISSQRPVAFSWNYNEGGAHMMVAVAYKAAGGETLIDALDPLPEKKGRHKVLTYEEYVSAETYTHDIDYYGFSTRP
jgi:Papain-like cysteine protease AvrRpt2